MKGEREPSTPRPVILAVDYDAEALGRVERELRTRYEADYRVAGERSINGALEMLWGSRDRRSRGLGHRGAADGRDERGGVPLPGS